MKHFAKFALAALVLAGVTMSAVPAHAVSYYDSSGRAYYYNTWGQPVYYDTGYNASTAYSAPASAPAAGGYTQTAYVPAAQPQYAYAQPAYQQPTTYYAPAYAPVPSQTYYSQQQPVGYEQPLMAAVPGAPVDNTQTTYQYYYPDGTAASTTYVSATTATPVAAGVCRQSSRTEKQWGEIRTRYTTECQQPDGTWLEQ